VSNLTLQQVAPGRYEGMFTPGEEGAYFIGVGNAGEQGSGGIEENPQSAIENPQLSQTAGWVLGYSPEYVNLESDPRLLEALAAETGGRVLELESGPGAVFEHNLTAEPARQPIWPWLLLAAVVLLPVDVALRRLVLTREDWRRAWAALGGRVLGWTERRPAASGGRPEPEQMARLFAAKERVAERRPADDGRPAADDGGRPEASEIVEQPGGSSQTASGSVELEDPAAGETAEAPQSGSELASRLLERKRRRQSGDES
jgi:hypothetical protein